MFRSSCVFVSLLMSLNVVAAHAEHPLALARMDIMARVEQLHKRQEGVAVKQAGRRGGIRASMGFDTLSTTVQYLNVYSYNTTDCNGGLSKAGIFGTGICMPATSSDVPSTQSSMLSFASEVLYQSYYSDASCSVLINEYTYLDFSGLTEGKCESGDYSSGYYSVSSSFSLPNEDGFYSGEYISDSTCNSGSTPFFVYWGTEAFLEFDDVELNLGCYSEDLTFDSPTVWTADAYLKAGTTSHSSSSNNCFAGSEHVQLTSGESVRIDDVKLGDVVLGSDRNGKSIYTEVIAVPHARNNEVATFTRLETVAGKDILMTPAHLILVNQACDVNSATEMMAAGSVAPGMCLVTADQGLDMLKASNEVISREGIYTIVLKDAEFVVVNGIVASPFAVNHAVANAYYNLVRVFPSSLVNSSLFKQAALFFGTLVSNFAA